jgi:UDP-N-acetylglucosamine--N-acetylmuramyl-(pentapeptide) pyrophosphoryl-undecaprenol N-acetylglucosamine transferase
LIWQTGKLYYDEYKNFSSGEIKVVSFIEDMSVAYSAADLVIARAGATTIAEASALGIAVIFVPSPNVAANHQFKNAKLLTDKNAGVLLDDPDVEVKLFSLVNDIINDEDRLNRFRNNIKKFSKPEAAVIIAQRAIKLAEEI